MIEDRLNRLRAEMRRLNVDALIVPHADEFQNEYLPPRAERLAYVTGFTGSAGAAIVTADKAALFADGRYTLQAAEQSPAFEQCHLAEYPPDVWVEKTLPRGATLAYDPWLHTPREVETLKKAVDKTGTTLVALAANPVDAIWQDQPPAPDMPVTPHPLCYAGEESVSKRGRIATLLRDAKADTLVLTDPASIAWLLNVRGSDVPCTPLALSFALLHVACDAQGKCSVATVDWFIEPGRLTFVPETGVVVRPRDEFIPALESLSERRVLADPSQTPAAVFEALERGGAEIEARRNPCTLQKALKNDVEQAGSRTAHARDGAALARFLAWFSRQDPGSLSELDLVAKLETFRATSSLHRGPSFDTIAGSGPNGAIVHYRATEDSNRALDNGSFLLLDSGAQYLDGTTDITRTVPSGVPSDEMRRMFTLVLKGHIALATARFPKGTTGMQLDVLARQFLWQAQANYDHGTGHGIGSYLSVHEGPQRISPKGEPVELKPGMIVSNEPGFYKPGAYGIRIENLMLVQSIDERWNCFETLSFVPIDSSAVDITMLVASEREWLNQYHEKVREILMPQMDAVDAPWLEQATKPI